MLLEIQRNLLEMKMRNQETAAEGRPALLPELRFLLESLLDSQLDIHQLL